MTNPNHTDTSRSGDLKPCPFCAGDAEYFYRKNTGAALLWCNPTDHWVGCVGDCGASTCMHGTKDEAIDAWNARPADRIEALEAQIDRLASFIIHCIEGEPSQDQGAVDTAIRIMTEQATTIGEQLAEIERLREALKVTHNLAVTYAVGSGTLFYEAMAEARAALGEKQ